MWGASSQRPKEETPSATGEWSPLQRKQAQINENQQNSMLKNNTP